MFSGMVPSPGFQSRFFVLANENRTQDAGHALLRQGRNPKVRKNSGVIAKSESMQDFGHYQRISYFSLKELQKAKASISIHKTTGLS